MNSFCPSKRFCKGCGQHHQMLIYWTISESPIQVKTEDRSSPACNSVTVRISCRDTHIPRISVMMTVIITILAGRLPEFLCNNRSEHTQFSSMLASTLVSKKIRNNMEISGIEDSVGPTSHYQVNIELSYAFNLDYLSI